NTKPVEITSSVAVRTALSGFLQPAGVGKGIHDREGVKAGDSYIRTYTFTRTSGSSSAVTYNLSWVGNDGTFSSAGSISLPLNREVTLPVAINPTTAGSHAAILNLNDPDTAGVEYQTMNVVVAAEQFNAANNYSVTKTGVAGRNQALHYFFNVPAGTPAFKVDLAGPSAATGTGQVRFLRFHPYGVSIDSTASTACYVPAVSTSCNGTTRTVQNPQAGVWELTVEARRTSDIANAPFTLTASILGATVSPNPDTIESAQANVGVNREYSFKNLYGAFTGRATGSNLSSAVVDRKSIGNLEQKTYEVVVDAGSTALTARIGNPSDLAADLDLFVIKDDKVLGQSADGDSEEAVTIANPAAGTYTILIDGYAVPAGTTTYDYLDVFAHAKFGTVAVTDSNGLRPAGSTWTAPGVVTAKIAPETGRILLGNVFVRTDGNVTIGTGEVRVLKVE
nr:pre-peptidase C-terminal domain-containing protein [Chloroflexia bacterium]